MTRRNAAKGQLHVPRAEETAFLEALGQRVRTARAKRGMSRKILSQASGVSERYLAQLEGGQGNISIVLLRQVAEAMSLPVTELVAEGPERPVDLLLVMQLLERLSPEELAKARRLLVQHFGLSGAREARERVALVGLRGAGKSTLGRGLAERMNVPFIELDREIERQSGMALSEIFALYGQGGYRRQERRCLESVVKQHARAVIATGGSLVTEAATYELLLSACFTVWVRARPEEHMGRVIAQGDYRPMADNSEAMADLKAILTARTPLYSKADLAIDTAGKGAQESLDELVAALGVAAVQGAEPSSSV